jgi:polar amino acid transport system substrate-binding protein
VPPERTLVNTSTAHRIPGRIGATVAALAATVLLAACGSSAAPSGAPSTDTYPTQDVVSSIAVDPALKAELPASVQSSGTLRLGTTLTPGTSGLPHVGQTPDGTNIGLDVDLRNAVAKVLGVNWQIENGTFATIIPGVQNGKFDVGQDNFGVTKARQQVVDFSTYLNDGQAFLASNTVNIDAVKDLTDLCGFSIATTPGSTFQQILESSATKCAAAGKQPYTVQYFSDTGPIFLGLANGKVQIFFGPTLSLKYDATHVPNTKFLSEVSTTPVGFVTAKGSPLSKPLSDAVNKLIASGDYAKIFAKWGIAGSGIPSSQVNPAAAL